MTKYTSGNSLTPASEPQWLENAQLQAMAKAAGFARAKAVALPLPGAAEAECRFEAWVEAGFAGSMGYMVQRDEAGQLKRADLERTLPWARTAVVCWAPYHYVGQSSEEGSGSVGLETHATAGLHPIEQRPFDGDPGQETGATNSSETGVTVRAHAGGETGVIARYARTSKPAEQREGRAPSDYHKVLLKRLKQLEAALCGHFGLFEARAFVDTTPYSERELAAEAGLGWIGKNGCLIVPGMGSFGFLAVLFVSVDLPVLPDCTSEHTFHQNSARWLAETSRELNYKNAWKRGERPLQLAPNRCGSCTRCIEVCPTAAIVAPGVVDARRCVSYLTIEHRGPIEPELMAQMGNRVFGCDDCQLVCPWCPGPAGGRPTRFANDQDLSERQELVEPTLEWLGGLSEAEFELEFNGSPVRRAGYAGLLRNVAIAMGNGCAGQHATRLQEWSNAQDEGVRTAAEWALGRIAHSND